MKTKKIKINDWFNTRDKLKEYFNDNDCELISHSISPVMVNKFYCELLYYEYGLEFFVSSEKQFMNTDTQVKLFCRNNGFNYTTDFFPCSEIYKVRFKLYES